MPSGLGAGSAGAPTGPADAADREGELHDAGGLASDGDHVSLVEHLRGDEELAVQERLVGRAGHRHHLPALVGPALEHALTRVPELGVAAELPDEMFPDL